jgi:hypothetical protein
VLAAGNEELVDRDPMFRAVGGEAFAAGWVPEHRQRSDAVFDRFGSGAVGAEVVGLPLAELGGLVDGNSKPWT